jgi:uncharacterized membrane protein SirB2
MAQEDSMISYEIYKVIHLLSLFFLVSLGLVAIIQPQVSKSIKIGIGVASVFTLVGGMGLLARIGVSHGGGFPTWVTIKMVIWLVLAMGLGIFSKRGTQNKGVMTTSLFALILGGIVLAVVKPF